jgi:hypothetical protein
VNSVVVEAGRLSEGMLEFFRMLYSNCLLEFHEQHNTQSPQILCADSTAVAPIETRSTHVRPVTVQDGLVLVPLGGEVRIVCPNGFE